VKFFSNLSPKWYRSYQQGEKYAEEGPPKSGFATDLHIALSSAARLDVAGAEWLYAGTIHKVPRLG
jgi:hypothetical protein